MPPSEHGGGGGGGSGWQSLSHRLLHCLSFKGIFRLRRVLFLVVISLTIVALITFINDRDEQSSSLHKTHTSESTTGSTSGSNSNSGDASKKPSALFNFLFPNYAKSKQKSTPDLLRPKPLPDSTKPQPKRPDIPVKSSAPKTPDILPRPDLKSFKTEELYQTALWKWYLTTIPPYDAKALNIIPGSRGIVFTSSERWVGNMIQSIYVLRELGCKLPIQFSYIAGQIKDADLERIR